MPELPLTATATDLIPSPATVKLDIGGESGVIAKWERVSSSSSSLLIFSGQLSSSSVKQDSHESCAHTEDRTLAHCYSLNLQFSVMFRLFAILVLKEK